MFVFNTSATTAAYHMIKRCSIPTYHLSSSQCWGNEHKLFCILVSTNMLLSCQKHATEHWKYIFKSVKWCMLHFKSFLLDHNNSLLIEIFMLLIILTWLSFFQLLNMLTNIGFGNLNMKRFFAYVMQSDLLIDDHAMKKKFYFSHSKALVCCKVMPW